MNDLFRSAIVCDMTVPHNPEFPLAVVEDLPHRLRRAGLSYASITVAATHDTATALAWTAAWRRRILRQPEALVLAMSAADVRAARQEGKLAVGLHFQDCTPVGDNLDLVETFHALGIRHMILAYNVRSLAADGGLEPGDAGLSRFGLRLVAEMNRVGMLVDLSHMGRRSAREAAEASTSPVIVSHANVRDVFEHHRSVDMALARAVADKGGVFGAVGQGVLLGGSDRLTDRFVGLVDTLVTHIGVDHVGIGSDFCADLDAQKRYWADSPLQLSDPVAHRAFMENRVLEPEHLPEVADKLSKKGYSDEQVRAVLGENWLRIL